MNTNLSYAPNAIKVGFADVSNIEFADAKNLTVQEQKDIFFSAANRCRGNFIPTWSNEPQFFPVSTPPVSCTDNNPQIVMVTDLNANPLQPITDNVEVVSHNVQDLTSPPNKMDGFYISKKDILTFVIIGAGVFVITKILS